MNILRQRYELHQRQQRPHEGIEEFASEIRRLASFCQYKAFEETLIRDHVLFGLCDKSITLEIIENGGDPSLLNVIDYYSTYVPRSSIDYDTKLSDTDRMNLKKEPDKQMSSDDEIEGEPTNMYAHTLMK